MAGTHGFEPQPQQGSINPIHVGQRLAQRSMQAQQAQQPQAPGPQRPMSQPAIQPMEFGSALRATASDVNLLAANGGTGAAPKGPLAAGRLNALGISPMEVELMRRAGVL